MKQTLHNLWRFELFCCCCILGLLGFMHFLNTGTVLYKSDSAQLSNSVVLQMLYKSDSLQLSHSVLVNSCIILHYNLGNHCNTKGILQKKTETIKFGNVSNCLPSSSSFWNGFQNLSLNPEFCTIKWSRIGIISNFTGF